MWPVTSTESPLSAGGGGMPLSPLPFVPSSSQGGDTFLDVISYFCSQLLG